MFRTCVGKRYGLFLIDIYWLTKLKKSLLRSFYYPVKAFLVRFKKDIDVSCTFCNMHPETVFHLFWTCQHTRTLWQGICRFILDYIYDAFVLCLNDVLFGFTNYRRELDDVFFLCNLIIFLAKFYIHKCKVLKIKPSFGRRQSHTLKHGPPPAIEKL